MPHFITTRKRSLGQGNIFIGVCQEFCSQWWVSGPGGVVSQHALRQTPPPEQTPPGADPPRRTRHIPPGTRDTPQSRHPGPDTPRPDTPMDQTPPGPDTPPPQCRSCCKIRSTCGRYASYRNAILLGRVSGNSLFPECRLMIKFK